MPDQLFIAKIPVDFPNEQLIALFETVGEVKNFRRPMKRETGLPETYGFLSMVTLDLAEEAIARLNGYVLAEGLQPLVVKMADPPAQQQEQLFVAKIPVDYPNEQLIALFEGVGAIKNFYRKLRRKSGLPETYAFITMASARSATDAVERLNDYVLADGLPALVVKFAENRTAALTDNLFVTKIPNDLANEDLAALFEGVGEVRQFHRPIKRETGQPDTYAFIRMASPDAARDAVEQLNGYSFRSGLQPLVVKYAEERQSNKPDAPVISDPARLFVAPLPIDFPNEQLAAMFETVGEVADFRRPYKLKTGEHAEYAFVTMATPELAQEAIARFKGYSFGDEYTPMDVRVSKDRPSKPGGKTSAPQKHRPNEELDQAAAELADLLGETEIMPRLLVKQILYKCGIEQVRVWYDETMAVEQEGGMIMEKLGRRRTPGGVFFFIAKKSMPTELMNDLFPREAAWRRKRDDRATQAAERPPAPEEAEEPSFIWEERVQALDELFDDSGNTFSVKVVVVGRPDSVNIDSNQVTLTVRRNFQLTHVPKGVPRPPAMVTTTTVYVPLKMWNKVEEALQDPEDRLVVEGFAAIEPGKAGYSVYGTLVTTAILQRARFAKSDGTPE